MMPHSSASGRHSTPRRATPFKVLSPRRAAAIADLLQRGKRRPRGAARQQTRSRWREQARGIDRRIDEDADEAVLHLVPVLVAPVDPLVRIGIELVGGG